MWTLTNFMFEGIYLWFFLGIVLVAATVAIETERPGWCSFLLIATLLLLEFRTPYRPITFARQNPLDALVICVMYFAVGTGWIILKWFSHVNTVGRRFDAIKDGVRNRLIEDYKNSADYNRQVPRDGIHVNANLALTEAGIARVYYECASKLGERQLPLQVTSHKGDLYMWWVFWPLSMGWTLINDPVKRVWWFVYDSIGGLLQRISNHAFRLDS